MSIFIFKVSFGHRSQRVGFNSLSFSLKGSYSVFKGTATHLAPVGSPGRLDDPFSRAFSNYLQFPLVPPAKLPKVVFFKLPPISLTI